MNLRNFQIIKYRYGDEYLVSRRKGSIYDFAKELGLQIVVAISAGNALVIDEIDDQLYRIGRTIHQGCGMMGNRYGPVTLLPVKEADISEILYPQGGAWQWVDTTKSGDEYPSGHREMLPVTSQTRGAYLDYDH